MKKIFFGSMAFLMLIHFPGFIYGAVPASERAALITLYNSTNGDSWTDNSGWKDGALEPDGFGPVGSEGTWYGITAADNHITEIDLNHNDLTGTIPAGLANLSKLTRLYLHFNQLTGNIPPELGNLPDIIYLNLSANQLTGNIPPELANLSNLSYLFLASNQLTGSIPPELGNLSNLSILSLYTNQLTGNIPPELGNLTNLVNLYLGYNPLTGNIPPELGNLSKLEWLFLDSAWLTGSIPPELGNLSKLTRLYLESNQLTGSIPPELGNLSKLTHLYLFNNQLTGSIPTELGNLAELDRLLLSNNQLTGSIPPELGNLLNLTDLSLSNNRLTGSIPPELGDMLNLTDLTLYSNQLTGSIPPELGNLSNLTDLLSDSNQLTGSIPPELGNLSNLTRLYLSSNQLTGSIPPELGNLSNLTGLYLSSNQLTGSIPPQLGNLSNLQRLSICSNQLTGSIPPELGNLSNLTDLRLFSNQLTGSIPPELGNLSNLNELHLYSNQLTGSIPPELGNLSNLTLFAAFSNQLSGNIPPQLGNLSKLRSLTLSSNRLSGSIPPGLGNLSNLHRVNLSSNQLTGSIPTQLGNLANLSDNYSDFRWNGLYTGNETLRNFLNLKQMNGDWESTQTIAPSNVSAAAVSQTTIRVSWTPISYTGDAGGYMVYYSTTYGGPWIYSGTTADKYASYYDVTGLSPGATYYFAVQTQTYPHSENDNTVVSEYSRVVGFPDREPPFGEFATPFDGSATAGSIPVTGWALDDTGIESVKIYRAQDNSLIYIGDAVLVEGARPDVAEAYPQYPNNTRAGWGYMMLSNFLPGGGNGTFVLHAIATDTVGKSATLGTKTIICDNANAVKPFGAIDAPAPGSTVSGSGFLNQGWVLTPQPNSIPTDGSTIHVFVDGVNLGNPTYNVYRDDIATLLPGYTNSSGAGGYFYLDTTPYTNGVHTIFWTAEDDAGNADGIGSRYFTIQNSQGAGSREQGAGSMEQGAWKIEDRKPLSEILVDYAKPIGVIKGYKEDIAPQEMVPDDNGNIIIQIKELQRVEIRFFKPSPDVEHRIFNVSPLPIGSTLDSEKGVFCWYPGPGFIKDYRLEFIEKGPHGDLKKYIIIRISPEFGPSR